MEKRAIIVQRRTRFERDLLKELKELAEAAGYKVVCCLTQIRASSASYNIGKGKVLELKKLVKKFNVDRVIFFNELKPGQAYNLQRELGVEVIDRFELILEIFASRAGSREAKLQIELARLKRELSMIREYIHRVKIGELQGFMGGGRYAIDAYYRHVTKRISLIEECLEKIRKMKDARWRKRAFTGLYSVALTGYTGAGKTTLFNALTGLNEYSDGKPFATLSTKVRRVSIKGRPFLISDTIGFIDSLPELLLDAFYTTLGELLYSDLIILVLDISEELEEIKRKLEASLETLSRLSIPFNHLVLAANKIDLIDHEELSGRMKLLSKYGLDIVPISAAKKYGLDELGEKLIEKLPSYVSIRLSVPRNEKEVLEKLKSNCYVRDTFSFNGRIVFYVEGKKEWIDSFIKRNSFVKLA